MPCYLGFVFDLPFAQASVLEFGKCPNREAPARLAGQRARPPDAPRQNCPGNSVLSCGVCAVRAVFGNLLQSLPDASLNCPAVTSRTSCRELPDRLSCEFSDLPGLRRPACFGQGPVQPRLKRSSISASFHASFAGRTSDCCDVPSASSCCAMSSSNVPSKAADRLDCFSRQVFRTQSQAGLRLDGEDKIEESDRVPAPILHRRGVWRNCREGCWCPESARALRTIPSASRSASGSRITSNSRPQNARAAAA